MENKKLKDMTKEEFNDFMRMVKWDRFNKWAATLTENPVAQRDVDEVAKKTGFPRHSPLVMMATGFFAGVEAGVDLLEEFLEMDDVPEETIKEEILAYKNKREQSHD